MKLVRKSLLRVATTLALLAFIPSSRAAVSTGSFHILDGISSFPALFEIRQGSNGEILSAHFLWDFFYEVTGATSNADGSLKTIEIVGNVFTGDRLTFDLEQERALWPDGSGLDLRDINQSTSPVSSKGEAGLAIRKVGSIIELSWNSEAGQTFYVESTAILINPWELRAKVSGAAGTTAWQEAIDPNDQQRYYRLGGPVVINGNALSQAQLVEFETRYTGVRPLPGEYWYDSTSGLYGAVGYPSYGFMLPGHDFGPLQRNASIGNTGVLLNGRELPLSEWWVWSLIVYGPQPGTSRPREIITAGSYWLDAEGSAGTGDTPTPTPDVGDLYQTVEQVGYTGQGASGDNFWSTRFSAGNYDPSQGVGYVSVPGYGPVGFGF